MRLTLGILGVAMVVVAVALMVTNTTLAITEPRSRLGGNLAAVVVEAGFGFGGVLLARANLRGRPAAARPSPAEIEHRILALARRNDCRLTVAEVALDCDLDLEESKAALSRMHAQGISDLELTDAGELVYIFRGLLPEGDVPPTSATPTRKPPRRRRTSRGAGEDSPQ